MSRPLAMTVDLAIQDFERAIEGANSGHPGCKTFLVRGACSFLLESALRLVLPEIRNSIACGDGRFTAEQVLEIECALAIARGEEFKIREAA